MTILTNYESFAMGGPLEDNSGSLVGCGKLGFRLIDSFGGLLVYAGGASAKEMIM